MYRSLFYLLLIFGITNQINAKSPPSNGKVLFVLSNAHYYGNSDINTSNHFAEIVLPYDEFYLAGYDVDFVSPNGGQVPIGYINYSYSTIERYLYDLNFMSKLKHTYSPSEIDPLDYKAIFFVGGGSSMFQVPDNKEIQTIARTIYENNQGVISSICHGVAGILNIKDSAGKYIINGKEINGFPDAFEDKEANYYKEFPFSIDAQAKKNGAKFSFSSEGWDGYYIVNDRIVTGQDPTSARPMVKEIIKLLN